MRIDLSHTKRERGRSRAQEWLVAHANYAEDECLIWPFMRVRGYGLFMVFKVAHYAHRYMCELVNGPPPTTNHYAAHSCGRGHDGCVHPKHLSWKTPSENQRDRLQHGTKTRGRKFKLTPEQVSEIRSLAGQKTHAEIASMFGCTRENVGHILRRKNWVTGKKRTGGFAYKPIQPGELV